MIDIKDLTWEIDTRKIIDEVETGDIISENRKGYKQLYSCFSSSYEPSH